MPVSLRYGETLRPRTVSIVVAGLLLLSAGGCAQRAGVPPQPVGTTPEAARGGTPIPQQRPDPVVPGTPGAAVPPPVALPLPPPRAEPVSVPPRIGLALGGGAARGFAHVGVIMVLEQAGIQPDFVTGTSAGAVVGAIYAAGYRAADLQRIAGQLEEADVRDFALPDRGFLRGDRLQTFINRAVQNRPIEKLNIRFAAVATDLQSGEGVVFMRGDTGLSVRASSAVPGVFRPAVIGDRQMVDGGLTHPIPVRAARGLGADLVIAVDISSQPQFARLADSIDILLQTFTIMGRALGASELAEADVVIRPAVGQLRPTDFQSRKLAIAEGQRAAREALPEIRRRIEAATRRLSPPGAVPRRNE
ncbi:MAG: patatin-like phospholipase family protein [Burkholderiales bacterium]|nr:patatin-like phospholipase family protein [Burkholderiales bacterium]